MPHFPYLHYYAALLPRRGRILRRTLSVCPSVRPSRARMYFVYICTVLRANIQNRKTSVFAYGPASRMYFSARAEGRISCGHLGRTNSCFKRLLLVKTANNSRVVTKTTPLNQVSIVRMCPMHKNLFNWHCTPE